MSYEAAIIGAGGIAGMGILGMHPSEAIGQRKFQASHAGGYLHTDGVELTAVADVDEAALERFSTAWELPASGRYTDHVRMIEERSPDIVSVCTPTYLHADHVLDVARSDAPPAVIWCEKPIASNLADAREMCEACERAGIDLVVNHSFRFLEKFQQLRALVRDGLIGDPRSATATFRRELLRNSTHLIDMLVFLLDLQPARVSGYINGENDAVDELEGDREVDDAGGGGTIVAEDGTFATVDCTVAREISTMMFQLVGTEGKVYINNGDSEWRYWALEDGDHVEQPLPGIDGGFAWDTDFESAFPGAVQHIVEVLEGKAENLSPGEAAMTSLETIIGFYISHHTGSQLSLPIERPLADVTVTSW